MQDAGLPPVRGQTVVIASPSPVRPSPPRRWSCKIHNWKKPSELFTELVESNALTG
jgi:hypothetical protein